MENKYKKNTTNKNKNNIIKNEKLDIDVINDDNDIEYRSINITKNKKYQYNSILDKQSCDSLYGKLYTVDKVDTKNNIIKNEKSDTEKMKNKNKKNNKCIVYSHGVPDKIYEYIDNKNNIFITGSAGTGKTYITKKIIKYLYEKYKNKKYISISSSTKISAYNINGKTLYSILGLKLAKEKKEILYKKIQYNPIRYRELKEIKVLVIDEISMINIDIFDKFEYIIRKIKGNNNVFGGIQIILIGDFLQLPPIYPNENIKYKYNNTKYIFMTSIWNKLKLKNILLNINHRQKDKKFHKLLNNIRIGKIDKYDIDILNKLNRDIKFDYTNKNTNILPTVLYCTNKNVDYYNNYYYDKINTIEKIYYCEIYDKPEVSIKKNNNYMKQKLDNFIKFTRTKKILKFKINCQVMLLVDINKHNLHNGDRGVVIGFDDYDYPIVKFHNTKLTIKPHIWELNYSNHIILYKQIPLKLSYAATIHSTQGLTLDNLYIDFQGCFEYGQVYVALSRAKNMENLIIKNLDYKYIRQHQDCVNFYNNIIYDYIVE